LPAWFLGLAQIRGELVTVIDMARWLGIEREHTDPSSGVARSSGCLAVVEGPPGLLALFADAALGFRTVFADELGVTEGQGQASQKDRPVRGVTSDLLSLLDVALVFADPRLVFGVRAPLSEPGQPVTTLDATDEASEALAASRGGH
jgi:chemotaxis signal transduction protein